MLDVLPPSLQRRDLYPEQAASASYARDISTSFCWKSPPRELARGRLPLHSPLGQGRRRTGSARVSSTASSGQAPAACMPGRWHRDHRRLHRHRQSISLARKARAEGIPVGSAHYRATPHHVLLIRALRSPSSGVPHTRSRRSRNPPRAAPPLSDLVVRRLGLPRPAAPGPVPGPPRATAPCRPAAEAVYDNDGPGPRATAAPSTARGAPGSTSPDRCPGEHPAPHRSRPPLSATSTFPKADMMICRLFSDSVPRPEHYSRTHALDGGRAT